MSLCRCPSRGRRCSALSPRSIGFLLLCIFTGASGAPSKQDLIDHLGGTATGQTLTTGAYSLTVLSNETDVLVSCEIEEEMSKVGWLGFGVGSTMSDADIVILWPNSDQSWTLSHRRATTTALPLLLGDAKDSPQSDSTSLLSIVPSLSSSSSSDSPTIVTFSRPLNPSADGYTTAENYILKREINQGVIFAKGDENPGSEKQDADLKQHSLDSMGGSYVDLSVEFKSDSEAIEAPLVPVKGESSTLPTGGGGSSPSPSSDSTSEGAGGSTTSESKDTPTATSGNSGSSSSEATSTGKSEEATSSTGNVNSTSTSSKTAQGKLSYSTVIKIHAICAAAAWLFFAPLGVLYARLGRGPPGTTFFKFPWHFFQQTWIVTPLTFGAVGLAYYATTLKASSSSSGHKTLGFTFAVLLAVQVLLGWWTHESHEPPRPGRPPPPRALKAWFHIVIGVSLIGIGFVQVKLGMEKYGVTEKQYTIGYYAAIAIFASVYFGSLLFNVFSTSSSPPATPLPHHHHHHDIARRHHSRYSREHEHSLEHRPLRERRRSSSRSQTNRDSKRKKRKRKHRRGEEEDDDRYDSTTSGSDARDQSRER